MIAIQHLLPGTLIRLADGGVAEIRENPRDGTWVIARRVPAQGAESGAESGEASETDDLVHVDDIVEVVAG